MWLYVTRLLNSGPALRRRAMLILTGRVPPPTVVSYMLGPRTFRLKPPRFMPPNPVTHAWNEKGEDVSATLREWMGPSNNFHGSLLFPADMGMKSLTVRIVTGDRYRFGEYDVVRFY